MTTWNRRIAIAGSCVAMGVLTVVPTASAQQPPAPAPVAPITLSPEESQQLCNDMLPKLAERIDKLTARITGGPEVKGSVQWLKARAQDQRNKGHQKVADRLDRRAERRSGRIVELNDAKARLDAFRTNHCKPAGGGR